VATGLNETGTPTFRGPSPRSKRHQIKSWPTEQNTEELESPHSRSHRPL